MKRLAVGCLAVLVISSIGLAVLDYYDSQPWVPDGLWTDVVHHASEFREAAAAIQQYEDGATVKPDDQRGEPYPPVFHLNYYMIEKYPGGVTLFYRHRRFNSKGILGIAYAPTGLPDLSRSWVSLRRVIRIFPWLSARQMPTGFYFFEGR